MRLIDADALMEDICESLNQMTNIGIVVDGEWLWGKLNDAFEHAPTIEERKTGKIIIRSNMLDGEECYCSECDHWGLMPDYEFCPYCGADMRGEQND